MRPGQTNPMAGLYRRLRGVGLTKPYLLNTILPDWWDDAAAESPAGYTEGLLFLSRHLGLDLATLADPDAAVAFRDFGPCKFKKSADVSEDDLSLVRVMATRSAQLADAAMTTPPEPLPTSGAQVRREILGLGSPWVGLDHLAEYCWTLGVPVLHLSGFPKVKRPDGLAARVKGRPVIVLCEQARFSAWLLFILAHELGHIALGHIEEDGVLVDESMDRNVQDQEERDANAFAVELLTGEPHPRFPIGSRWPNARELARLAREIGHDRRIDPGHVVLNIGHGLGNEFWSVANASLGLIDPDRDGLSLVRRLMASHLDWSSLPEDSSGFLARMSQMETARDLPVGSRSS